MPSEPDSARALKCTMVIESDVVVVSRKIPTQLLDWFGFIAWNRFCDRLDQCLEPLRILAEDKAAVPSRKEQESAKIAALQGLQEICDKLATHHPCLQFTLYCPFHSDFVDNWHIQVAFEPGEAPPIANEVSNNTSTGETDDALVSGTRAGQSQVRGPSQTATNDALPETQTQAENSDITATQGQATPSSQTDDSESPESSNRRAPSFKKIAGLGVHGEDYIEHKVQPDDTLQGICLHYNIEPFRLKQANLLSGDNESLLIAPHKILAIPISEGFYSRVQETESKDYKLTGLRKQFPKLSEKEATAYLELADWVLDDALETAREDIQWEKEAKDDLF